MMSGLGILRPSEVWSITATKDTSSIRDVPGHRFESLVKDEFGERLSDDWITCRSDERLPVYRSAYYNLLYLFNGYEVIETELKRVCGFPMLKIGRGPDRRTTATIAIGTVNVDSNFFEIPAG